MRKILIMLCVAALLFSCSKNEVIPTVGEYTLTGYSSIKTKTNFGEPGINYIPFVWSEGDKIWSGSQQSNVAVINPDGSAQFTFGLEPETTIYYNMTGLTASQAHVLAEQDVANNLGINGDFGYAVVNDGTFTLEHSTAYLWFDVTTAVENATLEWVKFNADGVDVAGKATWNGSEFESVTEGASVVKLIVGQPLAAENNNVWAMVVLPADLSAKNVKVTYKLTVGGNSKYYTQTLSGKEIQSGKTQRITTEIQEASLTDYSELRVLTFENGSEKFGAYEINIYSHNGSGYDWNRVYNIEKWSDLIPQLQKTDPLNYGVYDTGIYWDIWSAPLYTEYYWSDLNNTFLRHNLLEVETDLDWDGYPDALCRTYRGGGHAISNFKEAVIDAYVPPGYTQDWSEVMLSLPIDAKSGSNFCVHNGYSQQEESMHSIFFSDGIARVIDHMYVTNTSYVIKSLKYGDSFNTPAVASTWFKLTAIGFNGANKVGSVDFLLCDGSDGIVEDWRKFDLSSLGKVTSVKFTLTASDDQCSAYGMNTPGYFAYDDVAVRFDE